MADETTPPLASFSASLDPVPEPEPMLGKPHDPEPETDAAARMRTFEDNLLGEDAVRIDGQVERGIGSPYYHKVLENPKRHAQYEALERLVVSEQKLAAAHAALVEADAEHEAAMAAVDRAEEDANAAAAE